MAPGPTASPPSRTASAKGRLVRSYRPPIDPAEVEIRQRELNAAKLSDYAEKILAAWPPLTDDEIDNVVAILRAGAKAEAG